MRGTFISGCNNFYLIKFLVFGNKKKSSDLPLSSEGQVTFARRSETWSTGGRFVVQGSTTSLPAALHVLSCKGNLPFWSKPTVQWFRPIGLNHCTVGLYRADMVGVVAVHPASLIRMTVVNSLLSWSCFSLIEAVYNVEKCP